MSTKNIAGERNSAARAKTLVMTALLGMPLATSDLLASAKIAYPNPAHTANSTPETAMSPDESLETMRAMPTIAIVVAITQRREGSEREMMNVSAPVRSGALPNATTVPTATPVERTAAKNVAP